MKRAAGPTKRPVGPMIGCAVPWRARAPLAPEGQLTPPLAAYRHSRPVLARSNGFRLALDVTQRRHQQANRPADDCSCLLIAYVTAKAPIMFGNA
eukprot:6187151-Pleurochrysis_carterae.AAC.2